MYLYCLTPILGHHLRRLVPLGIWLRQMPCKLKALGSIAPFWVCLPKYPTLGKAPEKQNKYA